MPKALDLTGQKFGRLTVDEFAGYIKSEAYYYCTCECGTETLVRGRNLTKATRPIKSCGCSRKGRDNAALGGPRLEQNWYEEQTRRSVVYCRVLHGQIPEQARAKCFEWSSEPVARTQ